MTSQQQSVDVLTSRLRRGARLFPWPADVMGACVALRAPRPVAALLAVPILIADLIKIPGTGWLLRRVSPIGQLAYAADVAIVGFQYSRVSEPRVEVDWVETPRTVALVAQGWLLSRLSINGRTVFVDRRCGHALIALWSSGTAAQSPG